MPHGFRIPSLSCSSGKDPHQATKSHQRSLLVSPTRLLPYPYLPSLVPFGLTSRSVSSLLQPIFQHSSTFQQPFPPSCSNVGVGTKTSAALSTSTPRTASTSRIGSDPRSKRFAPCASFSTLEATHSH